MNTTLPFDTGQSHADVIEVVRRYWGFEMLRPLQAEAVRAGLDRRDSLVVLPTGGGKSLCYQVPPLLAGRTDIVVSPLISLMKDQVDGLRANGYPAAAVHSGLDRQERAEAERFIASGDCRLAFVSPERLVTSWFLQTVERLGIRSFAVDEAHCISHWGHDFRPEYRQLAVLKERIPGASVHAYTATATPRVRDDIVAQLGLEDAQVLVGRFDRPNLTYRLVPRLDLRAQVEEILARHTNQAAIIYCISRKDTEKLAEHLIKRGHRAACYHAGLEPAVRRRTQEAFTNEQMDVVAATVAFGMGIDRSDVRCVIHAAMPKSIEHYQQETGRAGRDGLEAECVLLNSPADAVRWRQLLERNAQENVPAASGVSGISDSEPPPPDLYDADDPGIAQEEPPYPYEEPHEEPLDGGPVDEGPLDHDAAIPRVVVARESKLRAVTPPATGVDPQKAALELLDQMRRFCTPGTCRHQALSEYFGQTYEPPCSSEAIDTHADGDDDDAGVQIAEGCGACDVCLGETDGWVDGTRDAQMVLSCVARLGQMGTAYGMNHVVDVLRGADTQSIRSRGHNTLSTWGVMSAKGRKELLHLTFQLIDQAVLERSDGEYPVLTLNDRSLEVLRGERTVRLAPVRVRAAKTSARDAASWHGVDVDLFERLRGLRTEIARARDVPPYLIFNDASLRDMASSRPETPQEFLAIHGVGDKKLADFGETFLACIAGAPESIETASDTA